MRVIDYRKILRRRTRRERRRKLFYILLVLFLVASTLGLNYLRPLPTLKSAKPLGISLLNAPLAFSWPAKGQAAMGAMGYGVLDENPNQKPVPTASLAKVMTAVMVLKKYPLALDQPGPTITIRQSDVDIYYHYIEVQGSVIPVDVGEELSEYQALQALLLPSANNVADTLAVWAYGSMDNYLAAANKYADELGLDNTQIVDASGFSAQTVSTAHDMVILGEKAMESPVLAKIVGLRSASLPVVGEVSNTNMLLGDKGVIGIKTGHTEQAGGCYLFAAERKLPGGNKVTVVGAVMGTVELKATFDIASALLSKTYHGFKEVEVVKAGQKIGSYSSPWHGNSELVAQDSLNVVAWMPKTPKIDIQISSERAPLASGSKVGKIVVDSAYSKSEVSIVLKDNIIEPSKWWRIFRIF